MSEFKIGDRVVLSERGRINYHNDAIHPHNTQGSVYDIRSGGFYVKWDNECCNSFYPEEIELAKRHPHDALIREWLDNRDAVVEGFDALHHTWVHVPKPTWEGKTYRITYPSREAEQIRQQIAELQERLAELESKQ